MGAEHEAAATEDLLDAVLGTYLVGGEPAPASERTALLARYPQLSDELQEFFADFDRVESLAAPLRGMVHDVRDSTGTEGTTLAAPHAGPMPQGRGIRETLHWFRGSQ